MLIILFSFYIYFIIRLSFHFSFHVLSIGVALIGNFNVPSGLIFSRYSSILIYRHHPIGVPSFFDAATLTQDFQISLSIPLLASKVCLFL